MGDPNPLLQISLEPRFLLFAVESSSAYEAAWRWAQAGLTVRIVRGHKMRSEQHLFDEFGAAFQLPDYFGENWPALDECLADLSWLSTRFGYTLLITNAHAALAQPRTDNLGVFVRLLSRVSAEWAEPVELGEAWDRPRLPFHVVLQAAPDEAAEVDRRWRAAGAAIVPLTS